MAAATALLAARHGYRTIALSLDLAHSLSDSFDLDKRLVDDADGLPVEIAEKLSIQELDVENELRKHWGSVHEYIARLLNTTGLDEIVAEEIALLPGMAEVVGLLWVNRFRREDAYDVVVLDCAPTGESLRFLSMPTALDWYMDRVFKLERNIIRFARPIASAVSKVPLPPDSYFKALQAIHERLDGVRGLLEDPRQTSARIVTNAEKMVVRETRRAFMYISLYGLNVDLVIANRLLPDDVSDAHFEMWKRTQAQYLQEIEDSFAPVPIRRVDLFDDQVLGMDGLERLAGVLYGEDDPAGVFYEDVPFTFAKEGGVYEVRLKLPFVSKEDVELSRSEDQLIVRIGGFKRHVTLPRSLVNMQPTAARMADDTLCVSFERGGRR
jgi:arsenite-transporting ATPase